ncbi:MAG TPA: hypothetical protein VHV99_15955 [Paraburkholderia sp.]|nr:hypothetical protein [Paraburkholderia sp.]
MQTRIARGRARHRLHCFACTLRMTGMQHHAIPLRDKQPGGHLPESTG